MKLADRHKAQPPTGIWLNAGCSGKLKVWFSNQVLWWVDSLVLRNPTLRQATKLKAKLKQTKCTSY